MYIPWQIQREISRARLDDTWRAANYVLNQFGVPVTETEVFGHAISDGECEVNPNGTVALGHRS